MWEYLTDKIISISSISLYDEALIRSSLELFNNPKFQCDSKEADLKERYINDSQAERKIEHLLRAHSLASGCDRYDDKPLHYLDNFGYNSCFCNFTHPLIHYYLTLSENYSRGCLPENKSISDQSSRLIDIISLINFLKQDYEVKMQEEMHNKAKKGKQYGSS